MRNFASFPNRFDSVSRQTKCPEQFRLTRALLHFQIGPLSTRCKQASKLLCFFSSFPNWLDSISMNTSITCTISPFISNWPNFISSSSFLRHCQASRRIGIGPISFKAIAIVLLERTTRSNTMFRLICKISMLLCKTMNCLGAMVAQVMAVVVVTMRTISLLLLLALGLGSL